MEIIVSGRHFDVRDEQKAYVEKKIGEVLENDQNLKITSVRVVLEFQKNRCKAEAVLNMKNHSFEVDSETFDLNESIDNVAAKLGKQLEKLKDKLQDHHRRSGGIKAMPEIENTEEDVQD